MLQNRGLGWSGAALGAYRGFLAVFWNILGCFGASWARLGRLRGILGGVLERPGAVLGGLQAPPRACSGVLGRLGEALGQIFEAKGR